MRKLFWCGAALAVAGAMAVYLATDYVQRGADSSLAWAAGVSSKLIGCNLVYQAGQMVANCAGPDCPGSDDPAADEDSDVWIPAEPEPVAELQPAPGEPAQVLETIDVLQAAPAIGPMAPPSDALGAADGQAENRSGPAAVARTSGQAGELPALLPDPCDDAEDARYRRMPPCTDEEIDLPGKMPYATDEDGEPAPTRGPSRKAACCPGVAADSVRPGPKKPPTCPGGSGCSGALPAEDRGGHEEQDRGGSKLERKSAEQRLKELLRSLGSGAGGLRRPDLDTLEFRPSDARNGEFDRIPY